MEKQKILNGYREMRQDINTNRDRCLTKVLAAVKKYFKDTPNEKWSFAHFLKTTELDDIIFDSLEKTYSITAKSVKELYNITAESVDTVEIAEYMYSKDGKTLYTRLQDHFNAACERDNPAEYMFNRCVLIVDTETICVSNGIIHGKCNKHAKYAEVFGGANCSDGPCEYWINKGKMPIEELEELPPYHPDCECEVIYYFDEE